MERISIFNYEAFYLDFLEGNLSEEDAALLLAFLEEHPELKIDEEPVQLLEKETIVLDPTFKSELKQIEFAEDKITAENVEQFMIAELEGILPTKKIAELDTFVVGDKTLSANRKVYASLKLKPDARIVYADKNSLKRAKRIVLWPYISVAAAACVIAVFMIWNPSTSINEFGGNTSVSSTNTAIKDSLPATRNDRNALIEPQKGGTTNGTEKKKDDFVQPVFQGERSVELATTNEPLKAIEPINTMRFKKTRPVSTKEYDLEIIEKELAKNTSVPMNRANNNNDYAMIGFDDMNNPIKPITNRLASAVKQEVDFRAAKATEKHSGGFYLKIGKLEISHRDF